MRIGTGGWGVAEARALLVRPKGLDAALRGAPATIVRAARSIARRFEFTGEAGAEARGCDGDAPLLLAGVGDASPFEVQEAAGRAAGLARRARARRLVVGAAGLPLGDIALGLRLGAYRFDRFKAKPAPAAPEEVTIVGALANGSALRRAAVVADAVTWARDLVNAPPAEKRPARLAAEAAARLARLPGVRTRRYGPRDLERLRCGAILAVGRGSVHPPAALRAEYRPRRGLRRAPHLVLVGKGMTFDSGGLNIKPYEGMKEMKMDMGGAAAVLAALEAIARLGLPVRVTALCAFAENMPGPDAYKPGDIVRGRSGKTIEVLNTDAEGRVLLSDLLTIGAEESPTLMVDVATLTGAIIRALGPFRTGLFARRDADADRVLAAALRAGEPTWRMPMGREYREMIKGEVAEIKNVGGSAGGGASTAAHFLAEFVGDAPWAHLDIAGTAWAERATPLGPVGGTGAGVATLVTVAEDLAAA